jgi:hypothetical protein
MLGALFSALSGMANKAAKAVEEFGQRTGMPEWITGGISGALSGAGDMLGAGKDVQLPTISGGLAFLGDKVQTALGGFTREEALPQQGVKLGRSADIHNAPVTELPNKSPFEVTMNDVQVPALPMQVARSSGMGMNA